MLIETHLTWAAPCISHCRFNWKSMQIDAPAILIMSRRRAASLGDPEAIQIWNPLSIEDEVPKSYALRPSASIHIQTAAGR